MKILLAVDGSPYTQKMLDYLATHPALFGPSHDYTVLTVQPALPPRVRAAVGQEVLDSYYAEETQRILASASTLLASHGIHSQSIGKVGPTGETIAQFADAGGFDLLVMGSHGHGALGNLVMGSVATQVLAHCRVPVLLVR
jgi:nucleotide-binding universal stress UspA family protein